MFGVRSLSLSSNIVGKRFLSVTSNGTISSKSAQLRDMIYSNELSFLMEAHNGLSAKIVEDSGFKGIWGSGLSISASMGVRDANEASWTQVMDHIEFMSDVTSIPILLDADTGYGNFNNARRLVGKLEQRNIGGMCIEDKIFPKSNSFVDGPQPLCEINEFCGKIRACKDAQMDKSFVVIARLESFIANQGLEDALLRANMYCEAGVDAILCHSKLKDSSQIVSFMNEWNKESNKYKDIPVVIVPTKYYVTPTDDFRDLGISTVIWANHNLRSSITAMKNVSQQIYNDESLINIEKTIASVDDVFEITNNKELKQAEKLYLPLAQQQELSDEQQVHVQTSKHHTIEKQGLKMDSSMLFDVLYENNIKQYFGVPDSLMKDFLACIEYKAGLSSGDNENVDIRNTITSNEGTAVSMAAGYFLATNEIPCIYLQNSGFGNIMNPLMSILKMYDIPMLFFIGWRGEEGINDEPQHKYQGKFMQDMIKSVDIKHAILPQTNDVNVIKNTMNDAIQYIKDTQKPFFILVKKDTFNKFENTNNNTNFIDLPLKRYDVIKDITMKLGNGNNGGLFVSTTGYTSRELYDIREKYFNGMHSKDFKMVGGMGHCNSVALGIAMNSKNKNVICIDGDGGMLMHLGSMSTIGQAIANNELNSNFIHVLINNGCHESVGEQKLQHSVNFCKLAESVGFDETYQIDTQIKLNNCLETIKNELSLSQESGSNKLTYFIEILVKPGTIDNLGRPKHNFIEQKDDFMAHLTAEKQKDEKFGLN